MDTFGAYDTMLPKLLENLAIGKSTYGPFEYILFLDNLFHSQWIGIAQSTGLGMGFGIFAVAFITRLAFVPIGFYG